MKIKKLEISDSPNSRNLKILAIGDPHGDLTKIKSFPLKDADLILLTGDLGSSNLMRKIFFQNMKRKKQGLLPIPYSARLEKRAFLEPYISTIKIIRYLSKFAPVYVILGNVESSNSETLEKSKEIGLKLPFLENKLNPMKNVKIINNKSVSFHGIKIGGIGYFTDASWVREFKPRDFRENLISAKKETARIVKKLNKFGKIDILLCHQPPYGILDRVSNNFVPRDWIGKHAGSQAILNYIKLKHPDYVFCGHIHEATGVKNVNNTWVYNLGVCGYKLINIPPN